MKIRGILCALVALAVIAAASSAFAGASESGGFYLGAKAGYSWIDGDGGFSDNGANVNATDYGDEDSDAFVGGAALGYDWSEQGVNLRTELEFLFYGDDVDYSADNATAQNQGDDFSADVSISTLMLNVYYDFDTGTGWTPYVGVGGGLAFIDGDIDVSAGQEAFGLEDSDIDETNFAAMGTLGVAYEFNTGWAVDMGLRYSYFGDSDSWEDTYTAGGPAGETVSFEAEDLDALEVLFGVRYTF